MATSNQKVIHRVAPYLGQLRTRELTNREVAALLSINEQHLSRVLKHIGLKKDPVVDRAQLKTTNAEKRQRLAEAARTLPIDEAARTTGKSVRTIYRWKKK